MPELKYEYKDFCTEQERTNNILEFFTFDLRDVNLGIFLVAIQISTQSDLLETIKQVVRDSIETFATQSKPLTAIDNLEKLFSNINNQTREKINTADYGKIQAALVYVKGQEIHFSIHNDFKITLLRKNRIFDIIKMTYGLPPRDYDKLFNRMYSGDIKDSDSLLITTVESWECFDTNRLPEITARLNIKGASEFLKNYLPEHGPYKLGGLLISVNETDVKEEKPVKANVSPSQSIKELLDTEETTSHWLSPTPWQWLKKFVETTQSLVNKKANKKHSITASQTKSGSIAKFSRKTFSFLKFLVLIFNRLFQIIIKIFGFMKKSINHQTSGPSQKRPKYKTPAQVNPTQAKPKRKSKIKMILSFPKNLTYFLGRAARSVVRLPKSTKWLFIVAIVLIAAFALSLIFVNKNNQKQEITSNLNEVVDEIKDLHTQANQATIFKDYARARTLLIEANTLINELPNNSDENNTLKQELIDQNNQQLSRANRLTIIPLPLELVDTRNLFIDNPNSIELVRGRLIITNSSQLALLDTETATIEAIPLPESITKIDHIINEDPESSDANLLILHDQSNITKFDPIARTFENINNTIEIDSSFIKDVAVYNKRLYRLDTDNNQIWRHLKTGNNFQAGQTWLRIPNNLSAGKSLIVDGLIYLLDSDKGIAQYNKGARSDWQAEELDPSIKSSTKIETSGESDYLYILDPTNQRLLVFNKDGDFVQQFTSTYFDGLSDLSIIESENSISAFLLNNSKIYVIQFELDI